MNVAMQLVDIPNTGNLNVASAIWPAWASIMKVELQSCVHLLLIMLELLIALSESGANCHLIINELRHPAFIQIHKPSVIH
jgi:hypothetical protein